jgi:hypothetical protein
MSERSSHEASARNIDLAFEFIRETLDDPGILDGVRDGVTFVLVPDDEPALAEANIASGIDAVRRGRDVYFKHVSSSEYASR